MNIKKIQRFMLLKQFNQNRINIKKSMESNDNVAMSYSTLESRLKSLRLGKCCKGERNLNGL